MKMPLVAAALAAAALFAPARPWAAQKTKSKIEERPLPFLVKTAASVFLAGQYFDPLATPSPGYSAGASAGFRFAGLNESVGKGGTSVCNVELGLNHRAGFSFDANFGAGGAISLGSFHLLPNLVFLGANRVRSSDDATSAFTRYYAGPQLYLMQDFAENFALSASAALFARLHVSPFADTWKDREIRAGLSVLMPRSGWSLDLRYQRFQSLQTFTAGWGWLLL